MKKRVLSFLAVIAAVLLLPHASSAVSPSNTGLVGLWEYPTAEMPGDGKGFISYSNYKPYRTIGVNLGLFPWLEFNLRLNEYTNTRDISEEYGAYKDKGADVKLLLLKQRGWIPSVAAGVLDMTDRGLRETSYFGVATWKVGQFAVTAGYASESYNGFYGGIAWLPCNWLELKAEYSPLDYTKDYVDQYVHPEAAKKKYNIGAVFKSPWGLNGSVSYQRGEEWCFGINYAFDLRKPLFGGVNKPKTVEAVSTDWAETDIQEMATSMQTELGKKGFGLRNVVVLAGDKELHVAFENIGYSSQTEGVARAVILAANMAPKDIEHFSCSPMVRGRPVARIELTGEQLSLIREQKFTINDIEKSAYSWAPKTKYGTLPDQKWEVMAGPGKSITNGVADIRVALALEPRIDRTTTQKAYVDRKDIDYIGRVRTSAGWEAYLKVRQPLENNVDIWWEPEMSDKTRIWKGVLSYVHKLDKNLWGLGELGWLDYQYFGANIWGRWYINKSPFWIGGRASVFKERDYDSFAGLSDYKYAPYTDYSTRKPKMGAFSENGDNDWCTAFWGEVGYHDSTYNTDVKFMYGKFADADKGYRVDAVRHWNDTSIGFYFTDTDKKTSGKGYTDIGMLLHIPLSAWYGGHASNTYYDDQFTLLSSFRLQAGVVPGSWMTPERLIGDLRPDALRQEFGPLMERLVSQVRSNGKSSEVTPIKKTYGFYEYVSGEWRTDKVATED